MTPVREALNEEQLNLILEALLEKERKHSGLYKSTIKSGYGKGSTEDKALAHQAKSEACAELASYLSSEWN